MNLKPPSNYYKIGARLFALIGLTEMAAPTASQAAPAVWTGPPITFNKGGTNNPMLATNQDRITPNVWITRGESSGIYNARTETNFIHYLSPADTEWANGTTANYSALTYTNWNAWALDKNGGPPNTVGVNAVLHLISENIYLDIKFTSWSSGPFSYQRSTLNIPRITQIDLAATNVVLRGTNGVPNQVYSVLAATNIALPATNWPAIDTSVFDPAGNFAFTNPIAPGFPLRFYRLRVP
jgi:hypothetical protein